MTTWHCAVEVGTQFDGGECGVARAVGMLNCPQCGTERGPFRENGEGPVFDFLNATALDSEGISALREQLDVRESADSGTTEVPERTED